MEKITREIGVYNEWGKLREAMVGIVPDNMVEPDYMQAFAWMGAKGEEYCRKYGGQKSIEVFPEEMRILKEQVEGHVKVLESYGVKVHRNQIFKYPEEEHFLDGTQRGLVISGGADFFRVIGKNVILLDALRYPFRRKQIYTVRPVLEPLLEGTDTRYVALPPPSPHYCEDDIFLENGDLMIDGHNVYVGKSGLATNDRGIAWLKQFLGPEYKLHVIKLASNVLHLDTVLTLNRKGLLTYYPDLVSELPDTLKKWDKIEVCMLEGETMAFGANHLSLDQKNIIVSKEYERVAEEFAKKGMNPIVIPLGISMAYGSGARCLTGVLSRDSE
jgi:glycine amidinotransferase